MGNRDRQKPVVRALCGLLLALGLALALLPVSSVAEPDLPEEVESSEEQPTEDPGFPFPDFTEDPEFPLPDFAEDPESPLPDFTEEPDSPLPDFIEIELIEDLSLLPPILEPSASPTPSNRLTSINGRFLLLNMHGVLFHSDIEDLEEEIAYAQWMNAGAIRVFATDNNTFKNWSGRQVGDRIADIAPTLRARGVKLIVALVNNHRPVPGEPPDSFGWMDGFQQLLLPFYTTNYPRAYLPFARDLIKTVQERGALDVILAWELGNELHATMDPGAIVPFMNAAVEEIRKLDPDTPILPGTISVEHVHPGNPLSPLGRWLYCEAPVDAYTLHSYDRVGPGREGISTISYDFDQVLSQPCSNGRKLPVLVEELGTSRAIAGVYTEAEEEKRLEQEIRQIRYVLSHPDIIGIGPWNAESPKVRNRVYYDNVRGLTSYGPAADGSGSCYDGSNGVRCRVEQLLRNLPTLP